MFDFSLAQVDGALIRTRVEANDELCLNEGSSTAIQSPRFSTLTATEIAKVMHPSGVSAQANGVMQRIRLNLDLLVEYRIIETDNVEVLLSFPVSSTPNNAYMNAWIWRDGKYSRTLYIGKDRMNAITGESSHFILTDTAAVDIAGQIRNRR